jgi:hypothetical protein
MGPKPFALLLLAGCSLTTIPDVSSEYSEPCEPALRLCEVQFKLAAANQTSVELRGNFRPNGWVEGQEMVHQADEWVTTLQLQWGVDVQYKFYVDGTTWVLDPANPKTGTLGGNNTNSLLEDVSCTKWTCASQ